MKDKRKQNRNARNGQAENLRDLIFEEMKSLLNSTELMREERSTNLRNIVYEEVKKLENYSKNIFVRDKEWAGEMFIKGWNPEDNPEINPGETIVKIAACMDILQLGLLWFVKIMLLPELRENKLLIENVLCSFEDAIRGDETEIALRGIIAGHADYLIICGSNYLDKIAEANTLGNLKSDIFQWYSGYMLRIYEELLCVLNSKLLIEEQEEKLKEIWSKSDDLSAYSLGRKCSGKKVDNTMNCNTKEREFRLMCQEIENSKG